MAKISFLKSQKIELRRYWLGCLVEFASGSKDSKKLKQYILPDMLEISSFDKNLLTEPLANSNPTK